MRPYSHVGHWEELKAKISSNAIEGELSYLEAIPILSPTMSTLHVSSEPIFQPICKENGPLAHLLWILVFDVQHNQIGLMNL